MRVLFYILFLLGFLLNCRTKAFASNTDTSKVVIKEILLVGNKVTKSEILYREILFKQNDTIDMSQWEKISLKTKENLMNLSLFNFVTISHLVSDNQLSVYVIFEERWYLWPYPIFEHANRNLSAFFHDKDWSRIHYGVVVDKYNFRGRRETLKLKLRLGYKQQYQIQYTNPYFARNHNFGFSIDFSHFRQHSLSYQTLDNQPVSFTDENKFAKRYTYLGLSLSYRKQIYTKHNLTFGYTDARILDTIKALNPNYFANNSTKGSYFHVNYEFTHDKRDYKMYPRHGYNFVLTLNHKGLGLIHYEIRPVSLIAVEAYCYSDIVIDRLLWGAGGLVKVSSQHLHPYFIENAFGYDDFLRSYEYNVIDGQQVFLQRGFIKWELIPERIVQVSWLKMPKFNKVNFSSYINLFFESGYVHNRFPQSDDRLSNKYLISYGIGLDLVTYYDNVFRIEYSRNATGGSGFFIHTATPF